MKIKATYVFRIALLLLFAGGTIFFYYSSPEKMILAIGVENAYALMFIFAFLGGLTTFSGVPYHAVLVMLAHGGLNPLYLGITAATGVIIGDATSYFIGYAGRDIVPQGIQNVLQRFLRFGLAHPRLLPVAFFLYGSLVPLSNDFIVISMGLARYPFWKVMVPLGLGNLVFNISLAYLAIYAYGFLTGILG